MVDLEQNPKIDAIMFANQVNAIVRDAKRNGFEVEFNQRGLRIEKRWKEDGHVCAVGETMLWHVVFNLFSYPHWMGNTFEKLNREYAMCNG